MYRCGLERHSCRIGGIGHRTVSRRSCRTGTLTSARRMVEAYGSPDARWGGRPRDSSNRPRRVGGGQRSPGQAGGGRLVFGMG